MENQNNFPYYFNKYACKTCSGKCCRGLGGFVWISMEELEKMAGTRKMNVAYFLSSMYGRFKAGLRCKSAILMASISAVFLIS